MGDDASFECPTCFKRYRLRDGMAGKRATCGCGASFQVTSLVEEPEEDGPLALADSAFALNAPVAERAGPAECSACRRPMKPDAVLCLHCGTDRRTGTRVASPPPPPPDADDPVDDAEETPGRLQMTATLWGINAQILSLLVKGLTLILGIAAGLAPEAPAVMAVAVGVALLGATLGGLGAVLCLAAPVSAVGRAALVASLGSYAAALGLGVYAELADAPPWAEGAGTLLSTLGLLCFVGFLLALANAMGFPEVSDDANKVFGYTAAAAVVGVLAAFVPIGGCILSIAVLALAVYAIWLYVGLLFDLSRSVAYRRDRG